MQLFTRQASSFFTSLSLCSSWESQRRISFQINTSIIVNIKNKKHTGYLIESKEKGKQFCEVIFKLRLKQVGVGQMKRQHRSIVG